MSQGQRVECTSQRHRPAHALRGPIRPTPSTSSPCGEPSAFPRHHRRRDPPAVSASRGGTTRDQAGCRSPRISQMRRSLVKSNTGRNQFLQKSSHSRGLQFRESKKVKRVKQNVQPKKCAHSCVSAEGFTPFCCANFVLKICIMDRILQNQ